MIREVYFIRACLCIMEIYFMAQEYSNIVIPSRIIDIWQRIVDSISVLLPAPSVMINRLQPPELEVFLSNINRDNPFPSGTRMPILGIYCEITARSQQRLKVEDARKDAVWAESPTAKAGIFSYLGYPLFWPDGEVFGTICVVDTKENKWVEPSDTLLQTVKEAVEAHLAMLTTISEMEQKNIELEIALSEVKTLKGLLPICSHCKKIRDDKGYWNQIEIYLCEHSEAEFSHGLCPDCGQKLYPDFYNEKGELKNPESL